MKKVEEEEEVYNQQLGEIVKEKVERMVEVDIDDKALAIMARTDALPYSVYAMNQGAAKNYRREIFNYLKKNYSEYFDLKEPQKDIDPMIKKMEEFAE